MREQPPAKKRYGREFDLGGNDARLDDRDLSARNRRLPRLYRDKWRRARTGRIADTGAVDTNNRSSGKRYRRAAGLTRSNAARAVADARPTRPARESILRTGYPGYDTSVGWMAYDDVKVRELTLDAMDGGFRAFKLKVGSENEDRDMRRAAMLREIAGDAGILMFDANQRWNGPEAMQRCRALASFRPL